MIIILKRNGYLKWTGYISFGQGIYIIRTGYILFGQDIYHSDKGYISFGQGIYIIWTRDIYHLYRGIYHLDRIGQVFNFPDLTNFTRSEF